MEAVTQTNAKFTPPQYLNSQETVLFDTRPSFFAVIGVGGILWYLILSVVVPMVAAAIAQALKDPMFWPALISWVLLVLLPLVRRVLHWRSLFYSLTDQRIMQGRGILKRSLDAKQLTRIGGMLDVSTYRITGLTFKQGLSGRVFNFGTLIFQTNHGNIFWIGIKDALNVRRLIEEKVSKFQEVGANQATYNEAVIRKVAEINTEESFGLVAPKHHASIEDKVGGTALPQAPSTAHFCPSCGAADPGEAAFCRQCGKPLR